MTQYSVNLPLRVKVGKSRDFIINLNHYRNTHYILLNKAKVEFSRIIKPQLMGIPLLDKIKVTYHLYPKDKRECDIMNVCSIQDKFFCDALTSMNVIQDDNYKFLQQVDCRFGSIDPDNPRVTAIIETI